MVHHLTRRLEKDWALPLTDRQAQGRNDGCISQTVRKLYFAPAMKTVLVTIGAIAENWFFVALGEQWILIYT